jgi:hypothetical protein
MLNSKQIHIAFVRNRYGMSRKQGGTVVIAAGELFVSFSNPGVSFNVRIGISEGFCSPFCSTNNSFVPQKGIPAKIKHTSVKKFC